jgi:ABC-type Fe3+/spermidine/putrescine transport system ATPase subunit
VALARSLVFEPKLLLMDEPLGALDKKLREHMQLEIKHLQRNLKITVIYVTHDQSEALTMSDRIAIMNDGRFEQVGTPDELYRAPANRFVADFIGETCFLAATVEGADGDQGIARLGDAAVRFPMIRPVAAGETLELMVRPEAVVPATEGSQDPNTVRGAIEEAVYLGEFTTYHIRLSDGQILFMKQQNLHGSQNFRTGEEIAVAWNTHDMRQV